MDKELILAVKGNDTERVKELLNEGAKVNPEKAGEDYPIIHAESLEMVKILVEAGSYVNTPFFNPLTKSCLTENYEVYRYLKKNGAKNVVHSWNDIIESVGIGGKLAHFINTYCDGSIHFKDSRGKTVADIIGRETIEFFKNVKLTD